MIQSIKILKKSNVNLLDSSDHVVTTHSIYISDPDWNEVEIYLDVRPQRWRDQPELIASDPIPISIFDKN